MKGTTHRSRLGRGCAFSPVAGPDFKPGGVRHTCSRGSTPRPSARHAGSTRLLAPSQGPSRPLFRLTLALVLKRRRKRVSEQSIHAIDSETASFRGASSLERPSQDSAGPRNGRRARTISFETCSTGWNPVLSSWPRPPRSPRYRFRLHHRAPRRPRHAFSPHVFKTRLYDLRLCDIRNHPQQPSSLRTHRDLDTGVHGRRRVMNGPAGMVRFQKRGASCNSDLVPCAPASLIHDYDDLWRSRQNGSICIMMAPLVLPARTCTHRIVGTRPA